MCEMPPTTGGPPTGGPPGNVQQKREIITTILAISASQSVQQSGGMGSPFVPRGGCVDGFRGGPSMGGPGGGMMNPQMLRQMLQNPEMMDMAILIMILQAMIQGALGNQGRQGCGGPGGFGGPGAGGGFPFGGGGGGDPCSGDMGGRGGSQLSSRFEMMMIMMQQTSTTTGPAAEPKPETLPPPQTEPIEV